MEKKKLLILGSDYGTLDTVHEAHKMGLHVIVTDTMATSPARVAADETWNISTTDIDALAAPAISISITDVNYASYWDFHTIAQMTRHGKPHATRRFSSHYAMR